MSKRRVVITGMGIISPVGNTISEAWNNITNGNSGVSVITKFDTKDRTGGTLASVLYGLLQGVQLFRVHNVKEINQGILVFNKILNTN